MKTSSKRRRTAEQIKLDKSGDLAKMQELKDKQDEIAQLKAQLNEAGEQVKTADGAKELLQYLIDKKLAHFNENNSVSLHPDVEGLDFNRGT